jgi:hypothetical protein
MEKYYLILPYKRTGKLGSKLSVIYCSEQNGIDANAPSIIL